MNKKVIWALALIAVVVIVLLLNVRGTTDINLLVAKINNAPQPFVFLSFTSIGVVIGLLLK